ncbi:MAG: hypothetical protein E6K06_08565 [Methanobacteriota archaeon]|nr:MAG: hypothetical protein E6K06_08565 [Euryarchaeota archaeon]
MTARRAIPGPARAIETAAHDDLETDDDVVRAMQDELHEAEEKLEVYRSDASLAQTLDADVQHTERTIPKKSHLWADWTVWNFRRRPVHRASAMPAEALRRTQASLAYFERLEVWHAVGMADPWLVGGVRLPSRRERFYLLYDWGTETTADRQGLR